MNAEGSITVSDPNLDFQFNGEVLWALPYLHNIDSATIANTIELAMSALDVDEHDSRHRHHRHHWNHRHHNRDGHDCPEATAGAKAIKQVLSSLGLKDRPKHHPADGPAIESILEKVMLTLDAEDEDDTMTAAVLNITESLKNGKARFNQAYIAYGIGRTDAIPGGKGGLGPPEEWPCINRLLLLTLKTAKAGGTFAGVPLKAGDTLQFFITVGECGTYSCSELSRN